MRCDRLLLNSRLRSSWTSGQSKCTTFPDTLQPPAAASMGSDVAMSPTGEFLLASYGSHIECVQGRIPTLASLMC